MDWNRPSVWWVKFFVIPGLAAFTLLLILSNVKHPDYYRTDRDRVREVKPLRCMHRGKCVISCSFGEIDQLRNDIVDLAGSCSEIELVINSVYFPEKRLMRNWINGTFKIRSLSFGSKLNEIDPGAFDHPIFSKTTKLNLDAVHLKTIDKDMLQGLNILQQLILISTNIDFTPRTTFLKFVRSSLKNLKIKVITAGKLRNPKDFLGTEELAFTENVDLSGNNFGALIDKDSFSMLKGVKSLLLWDCKIRALGPNTFDSIAKTITYIDLRVNAISTLPTNFFKPLLSSVIERVRLDNNPWNCTCQLFSFVEDYKQNRQIFQKELTCADPSKFSAMVITEPALCPKSTTTTTHTTKITQTSQTPQTTLIIKTTKTTPITQPSKATQATHTTKAPESTHSTQTSPKEEASSSPTVLTSSQESLPEVLRLECEKNLFSYFLDVKPSDVQFLIRSISPTGVNITVTKFHGEYSVLWFCNASAKYDSMEMDYNEYELGCNTRIQRDLILENLKQGETYVFCLIKIGDINISPFNCHSHYMSGGSGDEADGVYWLFWGSKAATISVIVVAVLLSLVVGGISAFYIIRWKPTLVKGSKRVIVVKKNTSDIIDVPRNSSTSSTETNQTTLSIQSSGKKHLIRSKSEGSISNARSYIMMPLHPYESVQYEEKVTSGEEKFYFDRVPKDPPPSIPQSILNNPMSATDDLCYDYSTNRAYRKPIYS